MPGKIRILFAGTPLFAVPALEAVNNEFTVCGILTAPDRQAGRGKKIVPSEIKQKASELGLFVFDPGHLDGEAIEAIKKVNADIIVVAAYGKIFREEFIRIFPMGGINIHPSLLPRHRGPSPIQAAILSGDEESGVTIQRLGLAMDSGNILLQEKTALKGDETAASLSTAFSETGARLVVETLISLEKNTFREIPQDESKATYCKLIKKEHGLIDWNESAMTIERKVRAYYPWPSAFTFYKENQLDIIKAAIIPGQTEDHHYEPGDVFAFDNKNGFLVQTGSGILGITSLKLQTKKETGFRDFFNGHKDFLHTRLGVNR